MKININSNGLYDLSCDVIPDKLKEKALMCINQQKLAAKKQLAEYQGQQNALEQVSSEALQLTLDNKVDVHGIATDRSISNVICFGANNIGDSIHNTEVEALRKEVDAELAQCLQNIFQQSIETNLVSSGHFWYPKASFMGWHTNSASPGWRIYINYAEDENESFFRYRNHDNEIVTLHDKKWNLRVFKISQNEPLWHCVYSNTNRFSLGYMLKEKPKQPLIKRLIKTFFNTEKKS